MSLTRDSLEIRELKIVLNAQFSTRQKIERERWKEKHYYPKIEAALAGRPVLGLEAGEAFEIIVEDAPDNPTKTQRRPKRAALTARSRKGRKSAKAHS